MHSLRIALPLIVVLLFGCGGSSSDAPQDETAKPAAESGAPDPCELLNDTVLRAHFEVGDAAISRRPGQHSPHPLCMISWPKPDAEARQAEFMKKMSEYTTAKARGEEAAMPKLRMENEINLTIMKQRFDSPEQAASAFDMGMDILQNGLKSQQGDENASKILRHDVEPVTGLGDKAAWVAGLNQISVQNDRRVFHLGINVYDDPETNRAKAMEIAKSLLEHIR